MPFSQLDAKKSPLALLAQTCSQIGADPSSKLLTPLDIKPSHKSSKLRDNLRENSSPSTTITPSNPPETTKSSFKPYESCLISEKISTTEDQQRVPSSHSASGRSRTPGSKRCSSNQSASSTTRAMTPQGRKSSTPSGSDHQTTARESPASRNSPSTSQSHRIDGHSPKSTYSSAMMLSDPSMKDLPLGSSFKPATSIPTAVSSAYLAYPSQLPIDVMTNSFVSQHHHAALKNSLAGNPYLSYARMKNSSGVDTLVPVCRDPYCTGCQLNSHLLANSTAIASTINSKLASTSASVATSVSSSCLAGCVQCDHKHPASLHSYGSVGHTAAAYAHAQLAALATASHLPYVCNWIAGDTAYCGKRFSSSEELLQHLRSHTSVSSDQSAAAAAAAATLSFLTPAGLPANHPLFSRTYPTPPLSPLATARYHPYGKASALFPTSLSSLGFAMPASSHPHPATLPPYFSPYSLYGGPRLGAASGMHH